MDDRVDFRISRTAVTGLEQEELFWAVIEPIWPDESVDDELAHVAKGTPGQRAIYTTTLFSREVDNGGVAQFLRNSSGMYARLVAEGLQILGADQMLEALLEASRVFPNGDIPVNTESRRKRLKDLSDSESQFLDSIDNRLCQGASIERRLHSYFKRYIDAHPEEFFID